VLAYSRRNCEVRALTTLAYWVRHQFQLHRVGGARVLLDARVGLEQNVAPGLQKLGLEFRLIYPSPNGMRPLRSP
jgi:hypothetical protein